MIETLAGRFVKIYKVLDAINRLGAPNSSRVPKPKIPTCIDRVMRIIFKITDPS